MKHTVILTLILTLLISLLSSCEVITGIFQAGMWFGIIIIVAIVIGIIAIIRRVTKHKS